MGEGPTVRAAPRHPRGVRSASSSDGSVRTPLDATTRSNGSWRPSGRSSPSPRTRPSRSASSSPTSNPAHEQRLADCPARRLPGLAGVASPARSRRSGASTSAARPRSWTPTSSPSWRDSPRTSSRAWPSGASAAGTRSCAPTAARSPLRHAADRPSEMVLSGLAGGMIAGNHWARAVGQRQGGHPGHGRNVRGRRRGRRRAAPVLRPLRGGVRRAHGPAHHRRDDDRRRRLVDRLDGLRRPAARRARVARAPTRDRPAMAWAAPQPTITDANLVIGRLDPDYFLGGEIALDVDRWPDGHRAARQRAGPDRRRTPRTPSSASRSRTWPALCGS